jgi:hypothetical protein
VTLSRSVAPFVRWCHNSLLTSATVQQAAARRRAEDSITTISAVGAVRSLREIAEEPTGRGVPTDRGGQWHPQSVARVLDRLGITPGIELNTGEMMATRPMPLRFVNAVITSPQRLTSPRTGRRVIGRVMRTRVAAAQMRAEPNVRKRQWRNPT